MTHKLKLMGALVSIFVLSGVSTASVIRVSEANFDAAAGLITFSEFAVNTTNPTYTPGDYGAGAGAPTVSLDGFFIGQSQPLASPPCGPGVTLSGCVVGAPAGPLALDPASPDAIIQNDGASPTSPVLSGTPKFNGSIALLFSSDVVGVGFDAGFFIDLGGTEVVAYARDGNELGSFVNESNGIDANDVDNGIEFFGLVTADRNERIAGLLFSFVGEEQGGFGIDNLQFGSSPQIPAPATLPLLLTAVLFSRRFLRPRS